MKTTLLALSLILGTFGFAADEEQKTSELVCKTRNNTTRVGEVGSVRIKGLDGGQTEVVVETITDKITKSEIRYEQEKTDYTLSDLPEGFVKNKMISFKRVSPNTPLITDGHFVYVKKSFPSSYKITVVNRASGMMKILPKCYFSDKFLTKVIKL